MKETIPRCNRTMDLLDCRAAWCLDVEHQCWCLEDVLYTEKAVCPRFQRLSIFVPYAYMNANGTLNPGGSVNGYTAATAPVVFENNSAGYMQMPHTWLGGPRCQAKQYLDAGFLYVTCGCRGRDSVDEKSRPVGAAPLSLVDLKTALRFLRRNRGALPGNWDRVISVGTGSGGALSVLLAASGDSALYAPLLRQNGAFMAESDAVFAAQAYCPELCCPQARAAYQWMFGPAAGQTGDKTPRALAGRYVQYFNELRLHDPETDALLYLGSDGRSGSAYRYVMHLLEDSATAFLRRLSTTCSPEDDSVARYLDGDYVAIVPVGEECSGWLPEHLGDLVSRPPRGIPYVPREPAKVCRPGDNKRSWLCWDGRTAHITCLDDFVKNHCHPCPLSETDFPADPLPEQTRRLLDPLAFLQARPDCASAAHYRIRMGTADGKSPFVVSLVLALCLRQAGISDVDYALVWDKPHGQADHPGAICRWIARLCPAGPANL